ncbi:caspase family protein [Streptomyces echinatus]|uniref:caspase family protein n=1 Tax=Streptomyces echinatus TaxID=67293 RepID=UPI00381BFD27
MRLPDFANSAALLVGVADYPAGGGFDNVPNALNNLDGLGRVLSPGGPHGFPRERFYTLRDPKAADGIRATLASVASQALDVLLFYYVGHGWKIEEELYLASTTSTLESIETTGIRYQTVRRIMRESPAAVRIVILDCCFSGTATTGLLGADSGIRLTEQEVNIPLPGDAEGVCVISSSGPEEPSRDADNSGYTAFTGHFLSALEAGRTPGERELGAVFRATKARMLQAQLSHTPLISVVGDAHRLALTCHEAPDVVAAPTPTPRPEPDKRPVRWESPLGTFEFPDSESATPVVKLFLEAGFYNLRSDRHDG